MQTNRRVEMIMIHKIFSHVLEIDKETRTRFYSRKANSRIILEANKMQEKNTYIERDEIFDCSYCCNESVWVCVIIIQNIQSKGQKSKSNPNKRFTSSHIRVGNISCWWWLYSALLFKIFILCPNFLVPPSSIWLHLCIGPPIFWFFNLLITYIWKFLRARFWVLNFDLWFCLWIRISPAHLKYECQKNFSFFFLSFLLMVTIFILFY